MTPAPSPPGEYPDRTLVLRAQDGDPDAFDVLIDRHQGRLFRIAYLVLGDRQDSEDVVQESLLTAWKRLHLLDDPDAVRSWLSQICSRRATDIARRRARRSTDAQPPELLNVHRDEGPRSDPAQTTVVNAQMQALARVLGTMDPDLRSCWTLREIDGMSYREVASALDITESTARGRLARARTHVIEYMKEWR
ncbi:MAG: RNA polymerase sigma factor [Dietzia sp.]|uniref:RNA polymerase sigma factor n=2 Tax=Dietzia TaxID=37914 RepID=A0AAD0NN82_9ACTN|nr:MULTISPECIES: RNA polymerase sigma factor [Dietzia]AWH96370.1 RNA polymerase subunit sigma-70 [Dietzia psychralcaliphila]MBB1042478.1 RNA polymerase sigma factor [Dietzia sp. Cai40]MDO8393056.1 RNA polymerase sigma factor [Dietzia sp.]PTM90505.1 RNA polymerase sigma-70 factor (ECF subfamily) [Dietzia psychralcaliphila]